MRELPPNHVEVKFGSAIGAAAQGCALLAFERYLRKLTAAPIEVFKETMPDDSKLRVMMTPEERARL